MPEKPVFWHFLEIFAIVFFWFFAQSCLLAMPKTWLSPILENMPEIAVFANFVRVFSSYFVVFPHKNIINNNTHHQACFNCHKNWFLMSELSKNRRNSQFSPEKQYFLNISSCTWYFFKKFLTLTQNDNVQNVTEPDFWKKYFSGRKCRKCAGKTGFWHFLEILSSVFSDFLHKDAS